MASSSSGPLSKNAVYQLGQYQFRLNVTKSQEGDSTQIQAQMTKDGQSKYHSIYVDGDATVESWSVEANESTADVYATVKIETGGDQYSSDLTFTTYKQPIKSTGMTSYKQTYSHFDYTVTFTPVNDGGHVSVFTAIHSDTNRYGWIAATDKKNGAVLQRTKNTHYWKVDWHDESWETETETIYANREFTHNGKTVYFNSFGINEAGIPSDISGFPYTESEYNGDHVAWTLVYGTPSGSGEYKEETQLVARFAIETQQAVDPTQPDQWDEQPDTGDPQYRLDLTVWGALSGRHNDPLRDPSYSYVPADQDSVKGYGGGGDGGHGGGGGGGASTVIVYDFGTDKAGSKEINAYARRHGYGSSGGRGGRGGDGCIIVYY